MAFPTGWNRKCALTISSSMVSSGSLSDFPLLLTQATLPSEMFDSDGSYPAQSDGGDIRFSSDSAGSTQLACEVVEITTDANPANGTAEIWVKVPSVTASGDTTIYVWYNTAGTTSKEGDGTTYGRDAVWPNEIAVWHGASGVDSSGNGNALTWSGSPSAVSGPFGQAYSLNGSSQYAQSTSTVDLTGESTITALVWVYPDSYASYNILVEHSADGQTNTGGFAAYHGLGTFTLGSQGNAGDNVAQWGSLSPGTGGWHYVGATFDYTQSAANELAYFLDGDEKTRTASPASAENTGAFGNYTFNLGARNAASLHWNGDIGMARLRTDSPGEAWIASEYNNQSAPATYITAGTPADGGGGGGGISVPTAWHHFRNLHAA